MSCSLLHVLEESAQRRQAQGTLTAVTEQDLESRDFRLKQSRTLREAKKISVDRKTVFSRILRLAVARKSTWWRWEYARGALRYGRVSFDDFIESSSWDRVPFLAVHA